MATHDPVLSEFDLPDAQVALPRRMTEEEFVAWCDEDVRGAP